MIEILVALISVISGLITIVDTLMKNIFIKRRFHNNSKELEESQIEFERALKEDKDSHINSKEVFRAKLKFPNSWINYYMNKSYLGKLLRFRILKFIWIVLIFIFLMLTSQVIVNVTSEMEYFSFNKWEWQPISAETITRLRIILIVLYVPIVIVFSFTGPVIYFAIALSVLYQGFLIKPKRYLDFYFDDLIVYDDYGGVMISSLSGKKGLYSADLSEMLPTVFDEIHLGENYIKVQYRGKLGLLHWDLSTALPIRYNQIISIESYQVKVLDGMKEKLISEYGSKII